MDVQKYDKRWKEFVLRCQRHSISYIATFLYFKKSAKSGVFACMERSKFEEIVYPLIRVRQVRKTFFQKFSIIFFGWKTGKLIQIEKYLRYNEIKASFSLSNTQVFLCEIKLFFQAENVQENFQKNIFLTLPTRPAFITPNMVKNSNFEHFIQVLSTQCLSNFSCSFVFDFYTNRNS